MAREAPIRIALLVAGLWAAAPQATLAATFVLPPGEESVVGRLETITTRQEDTFSDIARHYNLGYKELRLANPGIDPWLPGEGAQVLLPSRYVLPKAPRTGIVLNLAEMRIYYYPRPQTGEPDKVITYPVSIGRQDWKTPLGVTRIARKVADPTWYPPASVHAEHAADGDPLPKSVPPGPDNPLGRYALRLALPGYLIHGTNKPYGIGMRVTHGCVRLYPEDIEQLFQDVPKDTPVHIVDQPHKLGWHADMLYLEVHQALNRPPNTTFTDPQPVMDALLWATRLRPEHRVDWKKVEEMVRDASGVPAVVAAEAPQTLPSPPSPTRDDAPFTAPAW